MKVSQSRAWRFARALGDQFITSPAVRWTWSGIGAENYEPKFSDFRPADTESVRDMLSGRYLLGGRLVDTQGASPFRIEAHHSGWTQELLSFSWLRHFRDVRPEDGGGLARTLVLDWISRNGSFKAGDWNLTLLSQRVMNWLRHYHLLTNGATKDQLVVIKRSLNLQIQSARLRSRLSYEPLDELMGKIVLVAAALCDGSDDDTVASLVTVLCDALDEHVDGDGFYRSRNPAVQLDLIVELVTLRAMVMQRSGPIGRRFAGILEKMHRALNAIIMGTGEPAYFHGGGNLPTEILVSAQMQEGLRARSNAAVSGFGVMMSGDAILVMDSGKVPAPTYAKDAHSSALAFEFSYGHQLIVGNCGPAPVQMAEHKDAFRQAVAQSGPSVDGSGASRVDGSGILHAIGEVDPIEVAKSEAVMTGKTRGFAGRHGFELERRVSLINQGQSLVGQDKVTAVRGDASGNLALSFHLAPGVEVGAIDESGMVTLTMPNGTAWNFLWEGAQMRVDESARHSRNIGLHQTQQLILTHNVVGDAEIAWIFTRLGV